MLNFTEVKEKIAAIVGVDVTDVTITFTRRAYEIEFANLPADLTKKQFDNIQVALSDAVVRTITYTHMTKDTCLVVFGMNQVDTGY